MVWMPTASSVSVHCDPGAQVVIVPPESCESHRHYCNVGETYCQLM